MAPPHPPAPVAQRVAKALQRLHAPRHRREDGLFLAEGRRAIDGFLAKGWTPSHLLVRDDAPIPPDWPRGALATMPERLARQLSQATTPSGYLAAFPLPAPPVLDPGAGGLVLVGIADPGNLGTLLRSAAAFARRQVAIIGGADPWNHKVVQASAGALAALALHIMDGAAGPAALAGGAPLCPLLVRGGRPPAEFAPGPRWLVVGGEADGLPEAWVRSGTPLTLPMPGGIESLNAAVAGSIACYALGIGGG